MKKILVTKTFLPPQKEYNTILKRVWENNWLTNRGELVLELEQKLKSTLNVNNVILTNNGTVPLQIGLKIFAEKAEVITTPFSYVATTSAIIWEHCKPVFVDIDPEYLSINETKIEAAITQNTKAILATHVFGNPCNIEAINKIANKYNLKVIYDAAHCFGVRYNNNSIFNYGDLSTCSFHATKLFHTAEGGAMFCNNKEVFNKLYYSHNFGHNGPLEFHGLGINAKMSELQAAMGLAVLPKMEFILTERKKVVDFYKKELLQDQIRFLKIRAHTDWNYSYFPIIFNTEEQLLKTEQVLNTNNIFPRRYFYPSLNNLPYVDYVKMPVSESISKRILCLPLYVGLTKEDLELVITTINAVLR